MHNQIFYNHFSVKGVWVMADLATIPLDIFWSWNMPNLLGGFCDKKSFQANEKLELC
jgi:hypothetical protein